MVAGKAKPRQARAACRQAGLDCQDYPSMRLQLKGGAEPVAAHVSTAWGRPAISETMNRTLSTRPAAARSEVPQRPLSNLTAVKFSIEVAV